MKPIFRFIPFFIVLGVMSVVLALPVAGQTPDDRRLYIPIVTQEHNYGRSISIYGRVNSVIGDRVILTLDFFDGVTMMPIVANLVHWPYPPEYTFLNLPPLEAGQFYQVSYYNGEFGNLDVSEHLKVWHSFPITESANGSFVEHNFSVYNFEFLFPSNGRQVQSPFSFQWRRGLNENHYQLNLYDTNETLLYSTIGEQVESYLFDPLSAGLSLNTPYLWDVTIANPDGSIGIPNNPKREVTFVAESPIGVPTGLTGYCDIPTGPPSTSCHFSWQPVEGATQYFVESGISDHSPGGVWRWVDIPEAGGYAVCFGVETTTSWRVKARNDVAEGRYSDWQTVRVPPCPPPCSPCMREIFKEQSAWQPNGTVALTRAEEVTKK